MLREAIVRKVLVAISKTAHAQPPNERKRTICACAYNNGPRRPRFPGYRTALCVCEKKMPISILATHVSKP